MERTYRIHIASEMTGVSEGLIRAWERRYGVLKPRRTPSGYRAYTQGDIEVLKRLRLRKSAMPVLILTALDSVKDLVAGLDAGADDYLAKPFEFEVLEARVRALMRRGMAGGSTLIRHGPLTYDESGRMASLNGEPIELSARELGLLEILLRRAGRLVSKDQLVSHLCEWGEEVSGNAIEVYVHRLRRKLEPDGVRIVTVRGLGYRLENRDSA